MTRSRSATAMAPKAVLRLLQARLQARSTRKRRNHRRSLLPDVSIVGAVRFVCGTANLTSGLHLECYSRTSVVLALNC